MLSGGGGVISGMYCPCCVVRGVLSGMCCPGVLSGSVVWGVLSGGEVLSRGGCCPGGGVVQGWVLSGGCSLGGVLRSVLSVLCCPGSVVWGVLSGWCFPVGIVRVVFSGGCCPGVLFKEICPCDFVWRGSGGLFGGVLLRHILSGSFALKMVCPRRLSKIPIPRYSSTKHGGGAICITYLLCLYCITFIVCNFLGFDCTNPIKKCGDERGSNMLPVLSMVSCLLKADFKFSNFFVYIC